MTLSEGIGYQCTIYVDGRRVGIFTEEGNGGQPRIDALDMPESAVDPSRFHMGDLDDEYRGFD